MKTVNLNGNVDMPESDLLFVLADILGSNNRDGSDWQVVDGELIEIEPDAEDGTEGDSITWNVVNVHYFEDGSVKKVDLDY